MTCETPRCDCIIYHPTTPAERQIVTERMHYFRSIGDMDGVRLALAQLTGACPARQGDGDQPGEPKE